MSVGILGTELGEIVSGVTAGVVVVAAGVVVAERPPLAPVPLPPVALESVVMVVALATAATAAEATAEPQLVVLKEVSEE